MSYSNWNSTVFYKTGDVVYFSNGEIYSALQDSLAQSPPTSPLFWTVVPAGDIAGVIAGTGLSGGGSSGVVTLNNAGIISASAGTGISTSGTNPLTIGNTGVLSLDAQTGAVTTKCGGWHKNANQTINTTGAPSTVGITWQQSSYGDITTITQNVAGGSTFTVNQNGIYSISLQVQYANLNTATLTDTSFRLFLNCNRGGNVANIVATTFDFPNNTPANPTHQLNGVYQLLAGDQITFQTVQFLSAGSFTLNGQASPPTAFDYNTFWDWQLVKPLP